MEFLRLSSLSTDHTFVSQVFSREKDLTRGQKSGSILAQSRGNKETPKDSPGGLINRYQL